MRRLTSTHPEVAVPRMQEQETVLKCGCGWGWECPLGNGEAWGRSCHLNFLPVAPHGQQNQLLRSTDKTSQQRNSPITLSDSLILQMRKLRLPQGSSDASEVIRSTRGRGEQAPGSSSVLQAAGGLPGSGPGSLPNLLQTESILHPLHPLPQLLAGQTRHCLLFPEMVFPTPGPLLPLSLWLTSQWLLGYSTGLPIKLHLTLYHLDQISPPQDTSRVSPPGTSLPTLYF